MIIDLVRLTLFVVLRVVQFLSYLTGLIYRFQKPLPCPPIRDEVLLIPAEKLAEDIRNGEIKCERVIRTYISRMDSVNPVVNAIVDERYAKATKEAIEVDAFLTKTKLTKQQLAQKHPLLGVPITIKESFSVKGMSFTAGKVFRGGREGETDADVVQRVKEAGAIILAVTNTSELCINMETFNNVTGRTLNPYDTRRTCSGSSGGEAALLATGASLLGIGSDITGSIRLPAHHCGVWGHKPSSYSISCEGHFPVGEQETIFEEVFSPGPMARYATDLKLLLKVLLQNDKRALMKLNEEVSLEDVKIYVLDLLSVTYLTHKVDDDISLNLKKFTTYMKSTYGCKVKKIYLENLNACFETLALKLLEIEYPGMCKDENAYWELLKFCIGQSDLTFTAIIPAIAQHLFYYVPKSVSSKINELFSNLRHQLESTIGGDGILVLPCHHTPAHFHGDYLNRFFDYGYTGIFNATGLPATSCPMGLNSEGLPIGVQIVSSFDNDRLCLAVAEEIERKFGGWIPPKFAK